MFATENSIEDIKYRGMSEREEKLRIEHTFEPYHTEFQKEHKCDKYVCVNINVEQRG